MKPRAAYPVPPAATASGRRQQQHGEDGACRGRDKEAEEPLAYD